MNTKATFCLLICGAIGCGDGNLAVPRTAATSGTVTFKGKPVSGVKVSLHPQFDMGPNKFTPHGVTSKDGRFSLSTGHPNDGAPPGEYIATFELIQDTTDGRGTEIEVDAWKGKYGDPASSYHKVTIVKGDNVLGPFNLD